MNTAPLPMLTRVDEVAVGVAADMVFEGCSRALLARCLSRRFSYHACQQGDDMLAQQSYPAFAACQKEFGLLRIQELFDRPILST